MNIDLAIITETKKKFKGSKELNKYDMIYSGVPQGKRASAGVAILINKFWKNKIHSYTFINERILTIRIKIKRGYLTVIGVYAPEEGRHEDSEEFYEELQKLLDKINKNDYYIIAGDLNARIGKIPITNIVGTEGEEVINNNGYKLREFASHNELRVTNSFFRHKKIHKYTWSARGYSTIIDYVIVNKKMWPTIQDVRVFRGPDISSDHFMVVAKIAIYEKWKKMSSRKENQTESTLFKVNLLKDHSIRKLYETRLENYINITPKSNNINLEWNNIKEIITKAAGEALGRRKKRNNNRGLKFWNEELKEIIENKKQAYLKMISSANEVELKIDYKRKSAIAKRKVRQIKRNSWDRYISEIEHDAHGRQDKAYKIMKHLNKIDKDTLKLNSITEDEWLQYYKHLWTSVEDRCIIVQETDDNVDPITLEELQEAIASSKNKKSPGSDGINIELIKYAPDTMKRRILDFINVCWQSYYIPDEWHVGQICPLYKKGDRNKCENYRGISLLNTCYKLYARIIEKRLYPITDSMILDVQHGFRKGKSCVDCLFIITQLIEKRREFNLPTYFAFIDYEKAFDRVDRELLWDILFNRGVPPHLIKTIQSLYRNNVIQIKIQDSTKKMAEINQGVRQGCPLSPTLFNIYIDEITRLWFEKIKHFNIDNVNFTALLFADDQVIVSRNENDLQIAIIKLNEVASKYNMIISTDKTKVMAFLGSYPIRTKIVLNNKTIEQVNTFKYLGCNVTYNKSREIDDKLNAFNYFCGTIRRTLGRKVRKETLLKFYKVMALPALLYGCENWVLRKKDERRIEAVEMKFLRFVAGYTLFDKKRSEDIRSELKMHNIIDIIRRHQNNWREHIQRMPETSITRTIYSHDPRGRRNPGRPTKRWRDQF